MNAPAKAALPSFPEAKPASGVAPSADLLPTERMGRIVAVTGGHAVVLLDSHEGVFANSLKGPEIGTLLKADTTHAITLALVSALSSPMPSQNANEREMRIVEVEFIGELPKGPDGLPKSFRRGVSNYPSLGDAVYRANRSELAMAYACDTESSVRVGHIQQDPTIPAMIKVDDMLGKHFSILGTTGTGKSCTVALILRRILEKNPQAHILLLDVHREYAQSFQGISEVITPDNMSLPFWLLNFDEAVEILIGTQPNRDADVEILRELIPQAKVRYMNNQRRDKSTVRSNLIDNQSIGVDTPIPYRTSDLTGVLEEYIGKLDLRGELAPYKRLKAKLEAISRDPRYSFMFGSLTVQDNMAQVLSRIFRVPVNGKPIAILELGGLPSEIINVVVSVLARLAFDFGVWSAGRIPITFVCEEAHRYVPNDKTLGFEPTKRAISKIAKEGRKYGVSLCIVTQRPAELDPTILSQCNTIFSLRLTNEKDQDILKAGISDAAASLLEFMPTMGTGEAITFGEGVALPTRIKFDMLPANELPRSNTASFTKNWAQDLPDDGFLQEIVHRWRAQTYNPDAVGYSADVALQGNGAATAPPAQAVPPPGQAAHPGQPVQSAAAQALAQRLAAQQAAQQQALRGAPTGFGQAAPPPPPAAPAQPSLRRTQPVAPSQPGASGPNSQQNLASLLKQFRT
ncbi:MAG: ATP-binding protein [Rhizobiales bacterium]|nr:ATP-binding protein [Hyphomicrobiales bacterium]